jgi:hypothetical protein
MLKNILIILSVTAFFLVVIFDYSPQGKVYDCTLAEINPDYPIEVKNECRRLLKEYHDKEYLLQT